MTTRTPSARRRRALTAVALAAALAASIGACSSDSSDEAAPEATAKPVDPTISTALHDAAAATVATPSFQYSATIVSEGKTTTVVGDVVAPDKVRESTIGPDGQLTETIRIGSETWTKEGTGAWQSTPDAPGLDPDTKAMITALRDATVTSGTTSDMFFKLEDGSAFFETADGVDEASGQATVVDGHITRLRYGISGSSPSQLVTIDITEPSAATIDPPI
ncbi:MAG TPA: hypothetical protein VIY72_03310 [Acidimicrobiales bacterium]